MSDRIIDYCPNCEEETHQSVVKKVENVNIRGEDIPVEVNYNICDLCGESFDNPSLSYDPLEIAYAKYRKRVGLITPEQIKEFRQKYNLTQRELSRLLGFGGATLSRYENGALQDEVHDTLLDLIRKPHIFLLILNTRDKILRPEKRKQIIQILEREVRSFSLLEFVLPNYFKEKNSLINGYKKFDINKVINVIKFFCYDSSVFKTKLNKLLFYIDFKHFKDYSYSITGMEYAHLPYGPCPEHYRILYESVISIDKSIHSCEIYGRDFNGETLESETQPDLITFQQSEIDVILCVKKFFTNFTASSIMKFSHEEIGYKNTVDGENISYSFSDELKI